MTKTLTPQLVVTVAIICLGSLQFGYHMGELNSPEAIIACRTHVPVDGKPYLESPFGRRGYSQCIEMNTHQVGLVTSIYSIGGLFGSLFVGRIADKKGRKFTAIAHNVLFLIGSILNGTSNLVFQLLVGRLICGLGAGSAIVITSLLINELTPNKFKGYMGSMNQVSINLGILFILSISLIWCNDNDWRYLILGGAVVATVATILTWAFVDESPVWLANNGNSTLALRVLHHLRGGDHSEAMEELNSWKSHSESLLEDQASTKTVDLKTYLVSPQYAPSRYVTTTILVLQQLDGINSIIFYGVSILIATFPNSAITINVIIAAVNVLVTYFAATQVDKLGRKPMLLTSVTFLGISTFLMGWGIIYKNSWMCIIGTFAYITFFAIGMGPIPFLLVGEVTQPEAKGLAQSWGTTMNWIATFLVGFLFPILKESWLGGSTYFLFTTMCAISYWVISGYPETKGKVTYQEVWSGVGGD